MAAEPSFVLVHSPFVGPSTWRWVAASLREQGHEVLVPDMSGVGSSGPPYWDACVDAVTEACRGRPGPVALVGHGGAGPLLPAMAHALAGDVRHVVFAEAFVAPVVGAAELAPVWLWDHVQALASEGRLPKWSAWWDQGAMGVMVPDEGRRTEVEGDMPELPLDYFEQVLRVPEHWTRQVRCSYVRFSDAYLVDALLAARRAWPVRHVPGGHLHMVVDPQDVANTLLSLCDS